MSRHLLGALVPLALMLALPAQARPNSPPAARPAAPHPDPATLAAAERLIRDTGGEARAGQALDMMRTVFMTVLKGKTRQSDQTARIIDEVVIPAVRQHIPELEAQIAALYAADASLADLEALDAFYRSPLGRRALEIQGEVLGQSVPITLAWARSVIPDVLKAKADALRQRGVSL